MPLFDHISVEDIKAGVLAEMSDLEIDTREGSFADEMVGPMALEIWKVYQSLGALEPIVFVDENSGEYLLRECEKYGIERKAGTPATVRLTVSGDAGTTLPAGSLFLTASGLQFRTTQAAVLREGRAEVTAESVEVGESCNVLAGEVNRQLVSLPGVRSVINEENATGGTDPETYASLFRRLDARRKNPTTSGNVSHYYEWALEVDGIGDAKVIPCEAGPGNVGVLVVDTDYKPFAKTDKGGGVWEEHDIVVRCAAHIAAEMPIGPSLKLRSADALVIDVSIDVKIEKDVDLDAVRETYEAGIEDYFRSVCFKQDILPMSRFIWLLGSIDGVLDFENLKLVVNGEDEESNIEVGPTYVPVLGTVTLALMDGARGAPAAGAVTDA